MKTIEVKLHATLQKYYPKLGADETLIIKMDNDARLRDLLNKLNIPREEADLITVNGKWENEEFLLRDGDKISIFPVIAGG